ncbi:MAG: hypothetical protein JNK82_12450 [Myxococcaceae bacterium]|nr:hypothetical protein [Myxococcaceae bacterium]
MIQALPGVFRLFSEEPLFSVQSRGLGKFLMTGEVPTHRDPGLRLESRRGDASAPLAQHSSARDAFRALERNLPRGVHAHATERDDGLFVQLTETLVPAARLPSVQLFTTDLRQRIRRLDENRFELVGPTGSQCLVTMKVDTRRALLSLPKGTPSSSTAEQIAARCPVGYRAEVEGSIVTVWKDADLNTIAA